MTKKKIKVTPVLTILRADSSLRAEVKTGLGAVERAHLDRFHESVRSLFSDSLDIDKNLQKGREGENRWDYLLGHDRSKSVIAVEPHSAKQQEVSVVIRKKEMARGQLAPHLVDGAKIVKWIWVASGRNQFASTEKARLQLDQKGIEFVCPQLLGKHLP